MNKHFENLRAVYKKKCSLMISKIEECFSDKISFTRPQGGLFIWCTLPENADMPAFCKKAVSEYKIAVVPGNAFTIRENDPTSSFRLNFSTPTDEQLIRGTEILGKMTKEIFK